MGLIRKLYEVSATPLSGQYDLVVPMDYGTLRRTGSKILPKAGEACIRVAAHFVASAIAKKISWAETDKFGTPLHEIVSAKLAIIAEYRLTADIVTAMIHHAVNSISEVETIIAANPDAKRIIVVSDWRHTRRIRKIWKHFFKGDLTFVSTDEEWDEDHASWFCRSSFRRLLSDMAADLFTRVRGVEAMRGIAHTNFVNPQ